MVRVIRSEYEAFPVYALEKLTLDQYRSLSSIEVEVPESLFERYSRISNAWDEIQEELHLLKDLSKG